MADYYIDRKNGAAVRSELFERWKGQLKNCRGLFLQSMMGTGKTLLVHAFLNAEYPEHKMVSCREDWKRAVWEYLDQVHDGRVRRMVVLDDFQEIALNRKALQEVLQFFEHSQMHNGRCRFMFLSRGRVPKELSGLLHEQIVYAYSGLMMNRKQVELLMQQQGMGADEQLAEECLRHSQGWPWFIQIWLQYLGKGVTDPRVLHEKTTKEIDAVLDLSFRDTVMAPMFEKLIRLSVFDCFSMEMAEFLLGSAEGKVCFEMLNVGSSAMNYSADGMIHLHRFFLRYLRSRFQQLPAEEQQFFSEKAAGFYEEKRDIVQAVRCYYYAGNVEKMTEMTIILAENADGCIFAQEGCRYIDILPENVVEQNPDLIAAKAMLASYRRQRQESDEWSEKLHQYVQLHPEDSAALRSYLRLRIALPHGQAETVLDKFQDCVDAFGWDNAVVRNVTPTGDLPGVLNGGIDFCCFLLDTEKNYERLKTLAVPVLGVEAQGWAEIFRGEAAYQSDNRTEAIAYLTQGLSEANLRGNPRMQYAAVGNMARLFLAEGQPDTAVSLLKNMRIKATQAGFYELLPNIQCSEIFCGLRTGRQTMLGEFLQNFEQRDKKLLLVSDRYQVYTAAVGYLSAGQDQEALHWLQLLQKFAEEYQRRYLLWKVNLLTAVVNRRQGKEWKDLLIAAITGLEPYDMVRLAADEGAALLPLWKEIDWGAFVPASGQKFYERTGRALEEYAALYPVYLNRVEELPSLTAQEQRILAYLAEGLTNVQIAGETELSVSTIKKVISAIFTKLGVTNRVGAVKRGYLYKLI